MFKKKVRRILSMLMAIGLLFSLGIAAMATESISVDSVSLTETKALESEIELVFLGNRGAPDSQTIQIEIGVSFDKAFEKITIPTREYIYEFGDDKIVYVYTFIGWFTTPAGDGVKIHATDYITEDSPRTLYARWRGMNLPLPALGFFGNGGTPEEQWVCYTQVIGATFAEAFAMIEEPTKPGHTFLGWYAGGMWDIDGNYITFPIYATQAVFHGHFYAQWQRDSLSGLHIEWFYAFNFVVHVDDLEEMDVIALSNPFVTLYPVVDGVFGGSSIPGTPIVLEMVELPGENQLGKHGPIVIGIEEEVVHPITREIYFFVVDDDTTVSGDYVIYKNHIEKEFADRGLLTPELIVELSEMVAYAAWPFGGENVTDLVQFNPADIANIVNATAAGEFAVNFQISRMESLIAPLLSFRPPKPGEGTVIITLTDENGGDPQPGVVPAPVLRVANGTEGDNWGTFNVLENVRDVYRYRLYFSFPTQELAEHNLRSFEMIFHGPSGVNTWQTGNGDVLIRTIQGDIDVTEYFYTAWFDATGPYYSYGGFGGLMAQESALKNPNFYGEWAELYIELYARKVDLSGTELYPVEYLLMTAQIHVRGEYANGEEFFVSSNNVYTHYGIPYKLEETWNIEANNFIIHVNDIKEMDIIGLSGATASLHIEEVSRLDFDPVATPFVLQGVAIPADNPLGKHGPVVLAIEEQLSRETTMEIYFFVITYFNPNSEDYVVIKDCRYLEVYFSNREEITPEFIKESLNFMAYRIDDTTEVTAEIKFNEADLVAVANATKAGDFIVWYSLSTGDDTTEVKSIVRITLLEDEIRETELHIEWFYAFNFVVHVDDLEDMDVIALSNPIVTLVPIEDGVSGYSIPGTPFVLEMVLFPPENRRGKYGPVVIGIEEEVVNPITREIYFFAVDDDTTVSGDYVIYKNPIEKKFSERGQVKAEWIAESGKMLAYSVVFGKDVTDLIRFNPADIAAVANATAAGEFAVNYTISSVESTISPLLTFPAPKPGEGVLTITLIDENGGDPPPGVVPPPVLRVANGTEGDNWGTLNILENMRDVYRYRLYFSFPSQELAEHNLRSFEMFFHSPFLVDTWEDPEHARVTVRTVNGDIDVTEYFQMHWFFYVRERLYHNGFAGFEALDTALNNPKFYGEWAELYVELYAQKIDLSETEFYPVVEYLRMSAQIHVRGEYANEESFSVFSNNVYTYYGEEGSGIEFHIEWFYAFNFVVHVDDLEDMDVIALSNPFVTLMPIEDGVFFGGTSIPGTPIVLEMIELPTENRLGKHGPIVIGIEEEVVHPRTREIYFFVVDDDTTVSGDYVIYKNHIDKEYADRGLLTPELIVELSEMVVYGVICGENVTELVQFNAADIAAITNATDVGAFEVNYTISSIESLVAPLLSFPAPVPGEGVVIITLTDENGGDCETCDCEAGECDCNECETCDCEAGDCDCDDCEAFDCDDGTPGGGGGANQPNHPPLPGGGGGSPSPRTGDDNNIIFFSIVLVLATIAGTATVAMKKKQKIKTEQ